MYVSLTKGIGERHNIYQIKRLCEKTLWIENSTVMAYGDTAKVCKDYEEYCTVKAK